MLLQRSRLAATAAERPRLAPTWLIALLGTMVLVVLIAIYPHKTLIKRVLDAPPGEITEAYLVNLLRTDPRNPHLRILLARTQMRTGLYANVRNALSPALNSDNPQIRMEATWLLWQSEEARYQRLPPDSMERLKLRQALRRQLAEISAQDWSEGLLSEIARKTISFGDVALGVRLFDRLASANKLRSDFWYAEAARVALANGEYRAAAETFLIARARATSMADQRRHFLDAMRAMQSGDRIAEALPMAEKEIAEAPELANDSETLELLVRFARAAHRPDLADKYARRLLRLSLLEQWQREHYAAFGFDARPRRVALTGDEALPAGPKLPFDDKIYTLGFEAFLDNKKLEDAWKVAASAVHQAPENIAWRERLARVSEWIGRPRIGLDNWLLIARATGRDDAWQAVLRLAPGLFDDEALRPALSYQLSRQPNDEKLLRELAATYERLGDPQGGLRFLEKTYSRNRQIWILEYMADLAQRGGNEDQALLYWKRYLAEAELTPARAVRVATLMMLRGQADEGLALLETAKVSATESDAEFWRLTAQLARYAQKESTAIGAYRRLVGSADALAEDYEALRLLLQDDFPLEAAQVAAASWRRFQQVPHLVQALGHYSALGRWPEIGQLLGELKAPQLRDLRRRTDFLLSSAQYNLNTGRPALARRDLEMAVQLSPEVPEIQLALLWLLIDVGDAVALRRTLASSETLWSENPAMHDALGSAYLALSLPDIALRRYYTPHLADHRDDFLWLMNYADALEQNQDTERAWQLRQRLLRLEKQRTAKNAGLSGAEIAESVTLRRIARARLIISQKSGDPGLAVLRELLRLDRDAGKALSPAARDVALGWLQERGEYAAVRGWLWQQYANTAARPLWAEISLALALDDREAAGQLLDRYGERLPRQDRISAAIRVDALPLAQSDAFDTQSAQPNDDPLHLQLTEALLTHSDHAGGLLSKREVDTIDERERGVLWHLAISPRFSLDLAQGSIARHNRDANVIGSTPDETYRSARLLWRHADGESRLSAEERDSLETFHPLLFEHEQRIDARLSLNFSLGLQQSTAESAALRVAGMKDQAQIGLRYRPTQRDQIAIEHRWENFETQTGTRVGKGQILQIEASHALRIDPRDLEASIFWSNNHYNRSSNFNDPELDRLLPSYAETMADVGPDFFLPDNFRYYGIRLSTDTRYEREYTRAWRPYASMAKTWHSATGPGYELSAGIAGNVFGADHLNFGWKLGKGGSNTSGPVREIGLIYRIHY